MSTMQQTRIQVYALDISTLPNRAMNGYFARADYLRQGEATIIDTLDDLSGIQQTAYHTSVTHRTLGSQRVVSTIILNRRGWWHPCRHLVEHFRQRHVHDWRTNPL